MHGAEGNLPVEPSAGTSWQRERHWGLIGVGRYPRSDGYRATLIGLILCSLGGTVLFVRLIAVLAG